MLENLKNIVNFIPYRVERLLLFRVEKDIFTNTISV